MSHIRPLKLTRLIFLLLLLLRSEKINAQQKAVPPDKAVYDKAFVIEYLTSTLEDSLFTDCAKDAQEKIQRHILQNALPYYNLLIDSFPTSAFLFAAMDAKGKILEEIGDRAEAKKTFLKILEAPDNTEGRDTGDFIPFPGPATNYKYGAAVSLAQFDIHDGNFNAAIQNLDIANTLSLSYFCGNEAILHEFSLIELYTECYFALKDTQGVLRTILPNVINNNMASDPEHAALAYKILSKKYSKQDLRKNYLSAFRNRYTYKTKKGLPVKHFVDFVGHKIEISEAMLIGYKDTPFYKLLNE